MISVVKGEDGGFTLRLDEPEAAFLREVAAESTSTVEQLIAEAIAGYIDEMKGPPVRE